MENEDRKNINGFFILFIFSSVITFIGCSVLPVQAYYKKSRTNLPKNTYTFVMNETFSQGSPGKQVVGWYDETNNDKFNAEIEYANKAGLAMIRVTNGERWGKVQSYSLDVDLTIHPTLEIDVREIIEGSFRINLFSNTTRWEVYECAESITRPGMYTFDIAHVSGWAGKKNLGIELIVEGEHSQVFIRSVSIRNGGLKQLSTDIAWQDSMDFLDDTPPGKPWLHPQGWKKTKHTKLSYDARRGYIILEGTGSSEGFVTASTGKNITVDLNQYPILQVKVDRVVGGECKIEVIRGDQFFTLDWGLRSGGVFSYNLKEILGWNGIVTFGVQVLADARGKVILDDVRICRQNEIGKNPPQNDQSMQLQRKEKYPAKIVIGLDKSLLHAIDEKMKIKCLEYLQMHSDMKIELRELLPTELKLQFYRNEIDLVISYSPYFYGMVKKKSIQPDLMIRKNGMDTYQYCLYVSVDNPIEKITQLKGGRLGCLDKEIFPYLNEFFYQDVRAFNEEHYFDKLIEYPSPKAAVLALQMGSVDALVGIENAFELKSENGEKNITIHNQMRILEKSHPMPDCPVMVKKMISDKKRKNINQLLKVLYAEEWKQWFSGTGVVLKIDRILPFANQQ